VSAAFPFPHRTPVRLTVAIAALVIGVFAIVPAVGVIVISFTDIRGLPYLPVNWIGVQNYVDFFSAAHLGYNLNAIKNTLIYAVVATVVQIVVALLIAVLLNGRLRGRTFLRAIVFLPTVLGVVVTGLIWTLVFNPNDGPGASLWQLFGSNPAFFGDPHMALGLIIFVQIWSTIGTSVVIFLAGLQAIPAELYESADIDGSSAWQKLRFVTVPMLAPSVTATVLLGIVSSLQNYQLAYVLTGANNPATQLLSLAIFSQGFGGNAASGTSASQGYAAAISVVQFVIVGVVTLLVMWYLRRREARL
jgi:ABC-type sugar transport system permease subunit